MKWDWARLEVVVLLVSLVLVNLLLGKLDGWLESRAPDVWKDPNFNP